MLPWGTHEAPTLLIACDNACDLHSAEVSHMPRAGAGKPWQRPAGKSLFRHNPAAQKESTQQLLCIEKRSFIMCTSVGLPEGRPWLCKAQQSLVPLSFKGALPKHGFPSGN